MEGSSCGGHLGGAGFAPSDVGWPSASYILPGGNKAAIAGGNNSGGELLIRVCSVCI
jgi:hypothetical protein